MRRILLLLAVLLSTPPAFAQLAPMAPARRFEITPLAGYRLAGQIDSSEFDRGDVEIDESAVLGLELEIPIAPGLQIELMARRQETAFVVDRGVLDPSEELGDVTITHAHAGLLVQWGPGQVNGFVVVSGGLAAIDPEGAGLDAETRLSGSFGGGLKVFLTPNVGLRFEGRAFWTDFQSELDRGDRRRSTYDDALVQGEGTVGLILAF